MVLDWKPRITNDELDALAFNSVSNNPITIDKWAPLRFWLAFVAMAAFAIWLLTSPVEIASTLTKIPAEENKLSAYLFQRLVFGLCNNSWCICLHQKLAHWIGFGRAYCFISCEYDV